MSYKIMLKECIDDDVVNDDNPSWITNSYKTIPNYLDGLVSVIDKAYEKKFNLKLIYRNLEDKDDSIIGVEFPSEEEATMFMLRWS